MKKDLKGRRFGKLTVLGKIDKRSKGNKVLWLCRCDCGNLNGPSTSDLTTENTKSCGCYKRKRLGNESKTHGHTVDKRYSNTYASWCKIKRRCLIPGDPAFKNYGARGIQICRRWKNSFAAFLEDMGEAPMGYCIDRIDNDGDYEPGNCQWLTRSENTKKQWRQLRENGIYSYKNKLKYGGLSL